MQKENQFNNKNDNNVEYLFFGFTAVQAIQMHNIILIFFNI